MKNDLTSNRVLFMIQGSYKTILFSSHSQMISVTLCGILCKIWCCWFAGSRIARRSRVIQGVCCQLTKMSWPWLSRTLSSMTLGRTNVRHPTSWEPSILNAPLKFKVRSLSQLQRSIFYFICHHPSIWWLRTANTTALQRLGSLHIVHFLSGWSVYRMSQFVNML